MKARVIIWCKIAVLVTAVVGPSVFAEGSGSATDANAPPPPPPPKAEVVSSMVFQANAGMMVCSSDGRVALFWGGSSCRVMDLTTGKVISELRDVLFGSDYDRPLLAPHGKYVAGASHPQAHRDGTVLSVYDVHRGKLLWTLKAAAMAEGTENVSTSSCRFLPDGESLAVVVGSTIRTLRASDGRELSVHRSDSISLRIAGSGSTPFSAIDHPIAFTPDGNRVAMFCAGSIEDKIPFRPGSRTRRAGASDGSWLMMMDLASGQVDVDLSVKEIDGDEIAIARDGSIAVSGRERRPVIVDPRTGSTSPPTRRCILLRNARGQVRDLQPAIPRLYYKLAFSPDSKYLAAGIGQEHKPGWNTRREDFVQVWETASGREVIRLDQKDRPYELLGYSADGKLLVGRVIDGKVLGEKKVSWPGGSLPDGRGGSVPTPGRTETVVFREHTYEVSSLQPGAAVGPKAAAKR